jgi:hypothetical protein
MIQLDILNAILVKLRTVQIANGYQTDIGNRVFYQHDLPFEYGEAGAINLMDEPEPTVTELKNNRFHSALPIRVEAIAFVNDSTKLATGCNLKADIMKALTEDRNWGGLALDTIDFTTEKVFETAGSQAVRIAVNCIVQYASSDFGV